MGHGGFSWLKFVSFVVILGVISWIAGISAPVIQSVSLAEGFAKLMYSLQLALLLVILVVCVGAVWRLFWSLPSNVNYRYADFEGDADKEKKLLKKLSKKYLRHIKKRKNCKRIIGNKAFELLKELLDSSKNGKVKEKDEVEKWLAKYREFQDELVKQAEGVRDKYAKAVGAFTALSRESKLDAACVFFSSTLMIFEIAKIFNKRMTKIGAVKTVVLYSVNIFASSQMQSMASKACEKVGALAGTAVRLPGLGKALGGIVGVFLEFGINKRLAVELGNRAIKEFVAIKYEE